jgi:hypothetical protein
MNISLPYELWLDILKYTDVQTISNMICVNKYFNKQLDMELWTIIDNLYERKRGVEQIIIPKTKQTYDKYRYLIDWSNIILYNKQNNRKISEDVILWIPDKIDLEMICAYQTFSENLIRKVYKQLSWSSLLIKQTVPIDIIDYNITNGVTFSDSDWYNIWSQQKIDMNFVTKYIDKVQWHPLSSNKNIVSLEFIEMYNESIIWQEFTKHGISENIVIYFLDKFDFFCWSNLCRYTELSNEFIRTYLKYMDIGTVLRYQVLSQDLLNEIVDNFNETDFDFNFQTIAVYQPLSKDFIIKYKHNIPLRTIIRNKHIPRSFIHDIYKTNFNKN